MKISKRHGIHHSACTSLRIISPTCYHPFPTNNNTGVFHSLRMSIFLLSLLVGVALSRYINADDGDTEVLQPIISQTRQRRMCAELCMSGLGGDPCGEGCVDLMPAGLPIQYIPADQANTSGDSQPTANHLTRHDMCDVLCENNLGNPLCHCNATQGLTTISNFFEGVYHIFNYFYLSKKTFSNKNST